MLAKDAKEAVNGADIVLKVRRPAQDELSGLQAGRARHRDHGSLWPACRPPGDGRCENRRLRDGIDAAHHPRAGHGRPVLAGQSRRLPCGHRRHGGIRARDADDDDRGGHGARGSSLRHGSGRRRPAGDRDGAPPRRRRDRDRRAAGRQGAGRIARRQVHRRRGRGVQAGRDRWRLREGDVGGVSGQAGRTRRLPHRQAGHRHHDGAHSRAAGSEARNARDGRGDEAGLGGRRPRGRARRQCRGRASPARRSTTRA